MQTLLFALQLLPLYLPSCIMGGGGGILSGAPAALFGYCLFDPTGPVLQFQYVSGSWGMWSLTSRSDGVRVSSSSVSVFRFTGHILAEL